VGYRSDESIETVKASKRWRYRSDESIKAVEASKQWEHRSGGVVKAVEMLKRRGIEAMKASKR
jgi:hypothetical protein